VVLANNCVFTRTLANEKYIVFNNECASGPELHLAPDVMALASPWGPSLHNEREMYLDILDKLRWGELWFSYGEPYERFPDKHSLTLAAREFPMTFEEIRPGMVRGPERIVTMNSGVYGWPGDGHLHAVYKFDARGASCVHDFVTTVDRGGARTKLRLGTNESAVIEPIPAALITDVPVNARVLSRDDTGFHVILNGKGKARLDLTPFPAHRVTVDGKPTSVERKDSSLFVPLRLEGTVEVVVERAEATPQ
jgi:hypothetical protein